MSQALEYPLPNTIKTSCTWCDDNALLPSPVQVPVEVVVLKGVEGHVEDLQEVASLSGGDPGPGDGLALLL